MNRIFILCFLLISLNVSAQPFKEVEVSLELEQGKVWGTHSIPTNPNGSAVLMINGSGPTDRNGNSAFGLHSNMTQMLAHELAESGIASIRYDKRMIGASKFTDFTEVDMRFEQLVDDAAEWLGLLKKEYNKVYVLGHSEGALIALLANQKENTQGIIHLCGPAQSGDEIIYQQLKRQNPALADTARIIMNNIIEGDFEQEVNPYLFSLFRPSVMPYLQSWFKHSPSKYLGLTYEPVLVVYGTEDLQVDEDQAILLKTVQPKAEMLKLEGMNHVLKKIESGNLEANYASYNQADIALHDALVPAIIQFINKH